MLIFQSYSGGTLARHNLVENNRLGHAGTPPDDDGGMGIEFATFHNIIRYNYIYGNFTAGVYFKSQAGGDASSHRIYNNTIYGNTREGIECHGGGLGTMNNNIFKNNISIDNTLRE